MVNYHLWLLRLQVWERSVRPSSFYLFGLLLVAFLCGALTWSLWQDRGPTAKRANQGKINQLTAELAAQSQLLAGRELELKLSKESNSEMQEMFGKQHQRQQELERELAFYRSVMSPDENADGVAINGVELQQSARPGSYRLRLILTQLQKRQQPLKGRGEVKLLGTRNGKDSSIDLETLVGKHKLDFNFKYFQVLEVEFALPAGFEWQRLSAKVVVPNSRASKNGGTEQSYSVPELLTGEKDPGIILEQDTQVSDNPPQQSDARGNND